MLSTDKACLLGDCTHLLQDSGQHDDIVHARVLQEVELCRRVSKKALRELRSMRVPGGARRWCPPPDTRRAWSSVCRPPSQALFSGA